MTKNKEEVGGGGGEPIFHFLGNYRFGNFYIKELKALLLPIFSKFFYTPWEVGSGKLDPIKNVTFIVYDPQRCYIPMKKLMVKTKIALKSLKKGFELKIHGNDIFFAVLKGTSGLYFNSKPFF